MNDNNPFVDSDILKVSEIEKVKKISFWASLIYKFKSRNIKLLPSGENNTTNDTFKSIHFMWNAKTIKHNLYTKIDSIKANFFKHKEAPVQNTIHAQIISEDIEICKIESESVNNIIVPKPINKKNN